MSRRVEILPLLLSILALTVVSAAAEAPGPTAPPQIVAQGTAEVQVPPDRAIVRFSVQFDAKDAQAAQGRVNEAMQRVIQALRRLNIADNRIGTERLALSPLYESSGPPGRELQPRLVGYRAANQVRVEMEDLGRLAPVIDAAVGAGANGIEGVEFTVANDLPPRMRALRQASEEARAKARTISEALDVALGDLIEASEGGVEITPPRPVMFGRATMGGAPVQPGQMTVRATVTVRYAIRPK